MYICVSKVAQVLWGKEKRKRVGERTCPYDGDGGIGLANVVHEVGIRAHARVTWHAHEAAIGEANEDCSLFIYFGEKHTYQSF